MITIIVYFRLARRMSITLVYYGLNINATDIEGDKYLNFALASFVEIPACLLNWLIMEGMSRKMALASMFVLSGTTCVFFNLTPQGEYSNTPKLFAQDTFESSVAHWMGSYKKSVDLFCSHAVSII